MVEWLSQALMVCGGSISNDLMVVMLRAEFMDADPSPEWLSKTIKKYPMAPALLAIFMNGSPTWLVDLVHRYRDTLTVGALEAILTASQGQEPSADSVASILRRDDLPSAAVVHDLMRTAPADITQLVYDHRKQIPQDVMERMVVCQWDQVDAVKTIVECTNLPAEFKLLFAFAKFHPWLQAAVGACRSSVTEEMLNDFMNAPASPTREWISATVGKYPAHQNVTDALLEAYQPCSPEAEVPEEINNEVTGDKSNAGDGAEAAADKDQEDVDTEEEIVDHGQDDDVEEAARHLVGYRYGIDPAAKKRKLPEDESEPAGKRQRELKETAAAGPAELAKEAVQKAAKACSSGASPGSFNFSSIMELEGTSRKSSAEKVMSFEGTWKRGGRRGPVDCDLRIFGWHNFFNNDKSGTNGSIVVNFRHHNFIEEASCVLMVGIKKGGDEVWYVGGDFEGTIDCKKGTLHGTINAVAPDVYVHLSKYILMEFKKEKPPLDAARLAMKVDNCMILIEKVIREIVAADSQAMPGNLRELSALRDSVQRRSVLKKVNAAVKAATCLLFGFIDSLEASGGGGMCVF